MKRNKIMRISLTILPIVLVLIATACRTAKTPVDSKDLSYLYNPLRNPINPRYGVFNQSDQISVLSVKFFSNDLFFNEANPRGVPMAMMFISVRVYNISMGRTLQDTAFYNLEIVKDEARDEYLYTIPLTVEKGYEYIAEVKIMDKIRVHMIHAFVPFNTLSDVNRYNFYARGHFKRNELLNPVVRRNEFIDLVFSRKPVDTLFIHYYKPYNEIPYPPYMALPEKPMNSEPDTIVPLSYSDTLPMMFPREGIYLCTVGKDINEGFTFFNFGNEFPSMRTPEEMIDPLGYLASEDEMNIIRSNTKPKMALDDFWIGCGGNVEKARELIRIYYTRVLYANYYFTSFKEGWRTDRGMIYIIYGPPDKLYKTIDEESWGYRKAVVKSKWGARYDVKEQYIFFNFKKRDNKFCDNEYTISRSETAVTYWDKAVQNWRKGIVFRLDNPSDI
jgi:GWxTD domain-containing protein